jgi:hypothetical protein
VTYWIFITNRLKIRLATNKLARRIGYHQNSKTKSENAECKMRNQKNINPEKMRFATCIFGSIIRVSHFANSVTAN